MGNKFVIREALLFVTNHKTTITSEVTSKNFVSVNYIHVWFSQCPCYHLQFSPASPHMEIFTDIMSRQSFQNREYVFVFLGLNSTYKQKSCHAFEDYSSCTRI